MEGWPSYEEIRDRRRAERRGEALRAVREAARVAEARGARLIVFGSLARGGFHERSDLDLALDGPAEAQAAAMPAVWDAAAAAGFEADVVRLDLAPDALARRVRQDGRDPDGLA